MKTCTLSDFLESLAPWLSDDYIARGHMDANGHLVLLFNDGVRNAYRIEDCTKDQLKGIIRKIRGKGIPFEE